MRQAAVKPVTNENGIEIGVLVFAPQNVGDEAVGAVCAVGFYA